MRAFAHFMTWLCAVGTLFFAALQVVPWLQTLATPLALMSAFLTYAAVFPLLWLLFVIVGIRKGGDWAWGTVGAVFAGVLLLVMLAPFIARFTGSQTTPSPDAITVLSINVERGEADPQGLIDLAQRANADAVVIIEYTNDYRDELDRRGMSKVFPYRIGEPDQWANGTAIYSRLPIEEIGRGDTIFGSVAGRVTKGKTAWTIAGVHPVAPTFTVRVWLDDSGAVRRFVAPMRSSNTVLVGDFNATHQHYTMQKLYELGYTDAVRETGAGWNPTWPMEYHVPPLFDLDHALTSRRVVANHVEFITLPGSDHRGLVVTASPRA